MSEDSLLSVHDLEKHYPITEGLPNRETGRIRAVDGIDFDLHRGETLGLVGESGCGKSTAARALLRLEKPTSGRVVFDGEPIGDLQNDERKRFRRRASMTFQDPTSSFDPRMTIGEAVAEPAAIHGLRDRERRRSRSKALLERVGLSADDYDHYPHELSGGQKQRAALARALTLNPDLLVADEPVSALDVSVQSAVLDLIASLQSAFNLSILLISHDMNVVRDVCDRVAVMYLGEIVEIGSTGEVFADPKHPYTKALLASVPTPDPTKRKDHARLGSEVPDPADPPTGCRFHTRCPAVIQPAEYDLDQSVWRNLFDLRVAVRDHTIDIEASRERLVTEGKATSAAEISDSQLQMAIREVYDIPGELEDPTAEQALSEALIDLAGGNISAAENRFTNAFSTVCEQRSPNMQETAAGHSAACHLHTEPTIH
ncbi:ABC transporter ATP-binding protein [Halococcus salsus]|uniref:ABC transporter ATP-binding protein n=1 Tax=Halococcus salsus TaxID=2162894 RepID=UPI00135C4E18|nr:ABC transporter ATP-binding protein [Halococcus salsus]